MRRHAQWNRPTVLHCPYERLSQRLEEAARREGQFSNAAIIRRMRESFFADVEALAKSGTVKLPERPGAPAHPNAT